MRPCSRSLQKGNEIMKGYVTGGTGTENDGVDGFIGTYYDLNEVFGEE